MEWNGIEWNGMEWNRMEWNGMEWNGMEWNGMESNGIEWNGRDLVLLSIPHLITLRTQVNILQIGIIITKVNHFALLFFLVATSDAAASARR